MADHAQRGGGKARHLDGYIMSGRGEGLQSGICKLCNETFSIKSNRAIVEELSRQMRELFGEKETGCPHSSCANHHVPISTKDSYQSFGVTRHGSRRYRCKSCRKTFSVSSKATTRQKRPDVNHAVYLHLVNDCQMRRICKIVGISPQLLYDKIDFLDRQCRLVASAHEAKLASGEVSLKRAYLSVDRQEYTFNWGTQHDRRNVVLRSIATAENDTGYVFGMNLDFDSTLDPGDIELQARECHDYDIDQPHRKFARLWLEEDRRQAFVAQSERAETDVNVEWKAPSGGMQIRSEYVMYGHFLVMRHLLDKVEKIRIFMDQDNGMRPACMFAFRDLIKERSVDAFFVRIEKDLTQKERATELSRMAAAIREVNRRMPELTEQQIVRKLVTAQIAKVKANPKWADRWIDHPLPDMGEPRKSVVHLTDLGGYEDEHLANLYLVATLRGIDRFFMQVRRGIATLERPIGSASANSRAWYGKGAYSPAVAQKLMRIFRTTYNFVEVGEDKKTPAMRLGLTGKPLTMRQVINFMPGKMVSVGATGSAKKGMASEPTASEP